MPCYADGVEMSMWNCPICGEELCDPLQVEFTCCHSGHSVMLTHKDNGTASAFAINEEDSEEIEA